MSVDACRLAMLAELIDARAWYVARVQPQSEAAVVEGLDRRGVFAFTPMAGEWRRANRFARRKTLRRYPAAPGYVVVGMGRAFPRWASVLGCAGLTGLIGGDRPREITARMVEVIAAMSMDAPEVERFMATRREFGLGDTVEVTGGALAGMLARVVAISGEQARVVVALFGGEREARVATASLAAVA